MIFDVRYNISSLAFHDSMGRVLGASDLEYAGESKLPIEPAAVELAWNIAYMNIRIKEYKNIIIQ